MKNTVFIVTSILLINTSFSAVSANTMVKYHKVDAKCHVELVGGEQMILFARVKDSQVNKLVDTLVNRKVSTPFSRSKQQVYRAFECVLLEARFNSIKANQLFDKQPR
ncbi:MAG: hypothetical protein ACJA2G_001066 [Cognaticolwellia sp.]|jgi:hypothetical protein